MGDKTKIEWASLGFSRRGATWNPIIAINTETNKRGWFCIKKNPACTNCYAERMNRGPWGNGLRFSVPDLARVRLELHKVDQPLRWRIPRGIFVCSMTDLFGEFIHDDMRNPVMDTIDKADWHRFGLLTKRADKSTLDYLVDRYRNRPFPKHVWFGISIGNQTHADETLWFMRRMRELVGPEVVLWVSYEPSIGPVDWSSWEFIDWLVAGGESGPKARPMHPDWARAGRDWCRENNIAFHFKQWGQWSSDLGKDKDLDYLADYARRLLRQHGAGPIVPRLWCFEDGTLMHKVSRKADSGRLLEGRTWDEYPVPIDAETDVV